MFKNAYKISYILTKDKNVLIFVISFRLCAFFSYLVLEYCENSLDRVFLPEIDSRKYRGPLPTQLDFMLQLSIGLEYIHAEGIIHRDIKPGNVLISLFNEKVTMKWTDFGFAKVTTKDGESSMSGLIGTENYWAPEIHTCWKAYKFNKTHSIKQKIPMTIKSDVFSCACVFFKYSTSDYSHPFGKTWNEIVRNVCQSNPVNLSSNIIVLFAERAIG